MDKCSYCGCPLEGYVTMDVADGKTHISSARCAELLKEERDRLLLQVGEYRKALEMISASCDQNGCTASAIADRALTEKRFCDCGHQKHVGSCSGVVQAERDEPCHCPVRG